MSPLPGLTVQNRVTPLICTDERMCRGCGCTDSHACPGGCAWVLLDIETPSGICSQCAEDMDWRPDLMIAAFCSAFAEMVGFGGDEQGALLR